MGYLVDSKALDIIFDESLKISVINIQIHQFIASADILNLTDTIVDKTIGLRKQIKIKLPDAIIAATALASDLTLITNNTSDFKRVSGLKLFNPHEI